MVEEGKISAEQGVSLLDALEAPASKEAGGEENAPSTQWLDISSVSNSSYENKMLRVAVDSTDGDKVNIQLPVKIIRQVLKVTGKLPIQNEGMQNVDLDSLTASILECLDNETLGNIVDISASDGTTVKVYIG